MSIIRGLARATNRGQDTISSWIKVAGNHCGYVYILDRNGFSVDPGFSGDGVEDLLEIVVVEKVKEETPPV